MKSLKEQLNIALNADNSVRRLSDLELAAMKRCLLDMYRHIKSICDANGLTLMLTGGSCLGSIRHKGFIPWDDDLDLMMPRKDYDKLLLLCEEGRLGKDYEFSFPSKNHDAPCAFLKIYLKGSKIVGIGGESKKYPNGVFLDIFPIEGAPKSSFVRKIKGFVANMLRLSANMVDSAGVWSDEKVAFFKQSKSLYINMKCRQTIGRMLSVISHRRWICWYDRFVKEEIIGDYAVIPTGRKLYVGETLPADVYFPPSKGTFEGLDVSLPSNPDAYLKNLYGDYMWIPPVEKRESHMITEIQLPEKFYIKKMVD